MADRPLETGWPSLVNSTGTPGTGSRPTKETFDQIQTAISDSLYHPSLEEGPPEIALEVTGARGGYSSLDARLDAIQAAAAGGASTTNVYPGGANVVPNDGFLVWSAGITSAPDLWAYDAGITVARQELQGATTYNATVYGRSYIGITNPDATERTFYIDLVRAADITGGATVQGAALKNAKVAAGAHLYSTSPSLMEVEVYDGASTQKVGEQGSTTSGWVWSGATNPTYNGGCTLGSGASQLRLAIRMKGPGTGYVASPALIFGFDSLGRWPGPTAVLPATYGWSVDDSGALSTGNKAAVYVAEPLYILRQRIIAMTTAAGGTNTFILKKGSTTVISTNLTSTSSDTGWAKPASVALASVGRADKLTFNVSAAEATVRGPAWTVEAIRIIEPLRQIGLVASP